MEPWHEHANATDQVGYIPTMPREQTVSRRFRLVASPWPVFTEAKTFCWSPIRQICSYLVGQCTLALPGSAKIYKPETWKSLWRAPFASVPSKSVNFYLLTCLRCVCISPYALSPLPTPLYARVQIIKWPPIQPTPPTFSFFLPVPLTQHSFPMETYFAFQRVPTALRRRQIDPRWPERSPNLVPPSLRPYLSLLDFSLLGLISAPHILLPLLSLSFCHYCHPDSVLPPPYFPASPFRS